MSAEPPTSLNRSKPAVLPVEVLGEVITNLHPEYDRASLLALCLTSHTWWDLAAPVLYSHPGPLSRRQFRKLLSGGRAEIEVAPPSPPSRPPHPAVHSFEGELGPRARRALGYVKRLHVCGPLSPSEVRMMWDTAASFPRTPLFPRTRELLLEDGSLPIACPPTTFPVSRINGRYVVPRSDQYDEADAVVFDSIDVCVNGELSLLQVACYRARSLVLVTTHSCCPTFINTPLIQEWWPKVSMRIFQDTIAKSTGRTPLATAFALAGLLQERHPPLMPGLESLTEEYLPSDARDVLQRIYSTIRHPPDKATAVVCLRSEDPGRTDDFIHNTLSRQGWTFDSPFLQYRVYDVSGQGCPPCALCGESIISVTANPEATLGLALPVDLVSNYLCIYPQ